MGKKNRRTTRPLGGIVPGTVGFYRFYALVEALKLIDWKARDRGKVMWDHTMPAHLKRYLHKQGRLVRLDDITSIRQYVVRRGDRLMELNADNRVLSNSSK
jgi:hypothetical protein